MSLLPLAARPPLPRSARHTHPPCRHHFLARFPEARPSRQHSDTLRRYRCKDRIPGARLNFNYPTKAGYAKFNWIIVVPEYYNMKYIAHCEEMYDVNFAFNALSGDV